MENTDYYYHLGLDSSMPLPDMFGDVRVVLMCGSGERARALAERVTSLVPCCAPRLGSHICPIGKTDRYKLYKAGSILVVSHGMGAPSITILLHEITKMLLASGVPRSELMYVRLGTSGGIGLRPGSLVISKLVLSPKLEPAFEIVVRGISHKRSTHLDEGLAAQLHQAAQEVIDQERVASSSTIGSAELGLTLSCDDFYEGQARLDGAIKTHTRQEQSEFLHRLHSMGVRNIEMEAHALAGFCGQVGIQGGQMSVTLLNRLDADQIDGSKLTGFQDRLINAAMHWLSTRCAAVLCPHGAGRNESQYKDNDIVCKL